MSARQVLAGLLQGVPRILDEGLIILAWLALWRPTESLAYEWVPLYRRRRLYERLAGIRVTVHSDGSPSGDVGTTPERAHATDATQHE